MFLDCSIVTVWKISDVDAFRDIYPGELNINVSTDTTICV
jgi:hypothetical protein